MKKKLFLIAFVSLISMQLFSASMNSKVRKVPKNIQDGIFTDPKENIIDLTKFLASGSNDTASKVKIFHDWICDNIAYDCDVFTENGAGEQGYETVLKKRRAVCVGYANLLAVMCQVVDIECEIVTGWSKGFNYPGYLREASDHAWNAVKIGNRWQLIDVTWDAGFVDRKTFIKHYTTQWYNLSPAQFIFSHLPEEDKWQLLPEKQMRSHKQFEQEPYLPGVFFEYGLSLGKDAPCYTNEISGATGFDIVSSKSNVVVMGSFYGGNNPDLNYGSFFETSGKTRRFIFDVPDRKTYTTNFGARTNVVINNPTYFSRADFEQNVIPQARSLFDKKKITKNELDFFEKSYFLVEENNRYYYTEDLFDNPRNSANTKILKLLERNTTRFENVLSFDVKAADSYEGFGKGIKRFPKMYITYFLPSKMILESPLQGTLTKGSEVHFSLQTNGFSSLAIILPGDDFVFLKKNPKTGAFELDFTIPENLTKLDIYASKNNKNFETLLSYQID